MKATTIKLAMYDSHTKDHTQMLPVPAYYVPGTDDLLAVHHPAHFLGQNRYEPGERDWVMTHVPSGFSLGFTKHTRKTAIAYGMRLYKAAKKHHVPLKSVNPARLKKRWGKALDDCGIVVRRVA